MYLFTRTVRLAPGNQQEGVEWTIEMVEKVNQVTSLNVGVWTPTLSPGVGSMSFGCAVETLSDLEDAEAKLNVDPTFQALANRGAALITGNIEDQTAQYLHNPDAPASVSHVAVVQATMANGAFQRGVEVGIEIAQRATQIGGAPTSFLLNVTGAYAGCFWITSASSLRELETAEQTVNADPSFIGYVDSEAATCYLPGSAMQSIWRRIV